MKTLAALITIVLTSSTGYAADFCGQLQMRILKPVCQPDQMCAQYFREAHFLVNDDYNVELQTQDADILTQIVNNVGNAVCVQGEQPAQAKFFEVTSITPSTLPY